MGVVTEKTETVVHKFSHEEGNNGCCGKFANLIWFTIGMGWWSWLAFKLIGCIIGCCLPEMGRELKQVGDLCGFPFGATIRDKKKSAAGECTDCVLNLAFFIYFIIGNSYMFLIRQIIFLVVGAITMWPCCCGIGLLYCTMARMNIKVACVAWRPLGWEITYTHTITDEYVTTKKTYDYDDRV